MDEETSPKEVMFKLRLEIVVGFTFNQGICSTYVCMSVYNVSVMRRQEEAGEV